MCPRHIVVLTEAPRSLPSVSASPPPTAGTAGGQRDTGCLEMVRAAGCGRRPLRAGTAAGPGPPQPPQGRLAPPGRAARGRGVQLGPRAGRAGAHPCVRRPAREAWGPWVWAGVRGLGEEPRGVVDRGLVHAVRKVGYPYVSAMSQYLIASQFTPSAGFTGHDLTNTPGYPCELATGSHDPAIPVVTTNINRQVTHEHSTRCHTK